MIKTIDTPQGKTTYYNKAKILSVSSFGHKYQVKFQCGSKTIVVSSKHRTPPKVGQVGTVSVLEGYTKGHRFFIKIS